MTVKTKERAIFGETKPLSEELVRTCEFCKAAPATRNMVVKVVCKALPNSKDRYPLEVESGGLVCDPCGRHISTDIFLKGCAPKQAELAAQAELPVTT